MINQSRGGASQSRQDITLAVGSTGTDYAVQHVTRNANHTGGAAGYVNAGLRVDTTTGAGVTNFEWAIVGVNNVLAAAGEHVGIYGQGNMKGTGGTWGGVLEACDMTYTNSVGKVGLTGAEVDCYFNDTDVGGLRTGLSVVAGDAKFNRTGTAGIAGYATYGILVQSQSGGAACSWKVGVLVNNATDSSFQANANGIYAFRTTGTYQLGLDLSGAVIATAAIRMSSGQAIAFDIASVRQLASANTGAPGLLYSTSGTAKVRIRDDGGIGLNGDVMLIPGTYQTGAQTTTLGAGKPGTTGGAPGTWISIFVNGTQF